MPGYERRSGYTFSAPKIFADFFFLNPFVRHFKSFILPGPNVIKLFTDVIYEFL